MSCPLFVMEMSFQWRFQEIASIGRAGTSMMVAFDCEQAIQSVND